MDNKNYKPLPSWMHVTGVVNPYQKEINLDGDIYLINTNSKTAILKKGSSKKVVKIEESITYKGFSYSVVEIGIRAYNDTSSIEEIVITGQELIIQEFAFKKCHDVKTIIIRGHVSKIGKSAFYGCEKLLKVVIEGKVDFFESNAFAFCTSLKCFLFNDTIRSMSKGMFRECSALETIEIPSSIDCIPEAAFLKCRSLKSLSLPYSVTSIGKYAFLDCESLQKVTHRDDIELNYGCYNRTPLDPSWEDTHPVSPRK